MKLLIPVLSISFLILVHELGHFLSALYFGMKVKELGIGFGPTIFTKRGKNYKFTIKAILLGGFVDIEGVDDQNSDFNRRPYYQKAVVILAGIVVNLILAFIIFFSISIYVGRRDLNSNLVNRVTSRESALKVNDRVVAVDGIAISNWRELEENLKDHFTITILRDSRELKLELDSKESILSAFPVRRDIVYSLKKSTHMVWSGFSSGLTRIIKLLKGEEELTTLTGPIGIFNAINRSTGLINLLTIVAMISVSLALFNIIPIPPLDGGRLFMITLSSIGIKINKKIEEGITAIFTVILLLLTIFIGKNDIKRVITKSAIRSKR